MHLAWIVSRPVSHSGGRLSSDRACVRYRSVIPGRQIIASGHSVDFVSLDGRPSAAAMGRCLKADAVVVAAPHHDAAADLMHRARDAWLPVILDISDDDFDRAANADVIDRMVACADRLVAPTRRLQDEAEARWRLRCEIVRDPFEGPAGRPRFAPHGSSLRAAWFGGPGELEPMIGMLGELYLYGDNTPVELIVAAENLADSAALMRASQEWNQRLQPRVQINCPPWSPEEPWRALGRSDFVLLPGDGVASRAAMSRYRLVESIRAGRLPIANVAPVDERFADFAWLGDDLFEGIGWALGHAPEVRQRLASGQKLIEREHAPAHIANQWLAVVEASLAARAKRLFA